MDTFTEINKVFRIASDKSNVICPPEQVFKRTDFSFLLTIGGDLADSNAEYENLMLLLQHIGETEFYLLENLGATLTNSIVPFQASISVNSNYNHFQEVINSFDPPTGWTINHFFVFGKNPNWGIYICEYPTVNIIGCDQTLIERFKETYKINENGFEDLKEFIARQFAARTDLTSQFINNYRLQ